MWIDHKRIMYSDVLGLAEKDWVGKYQGKYYQEMKKKLKANKKEGN